MDQGFKIKLRADRESLFELFLALGFGTGRHHWQYSRWEAEVTRFLSDPHFQGTPFTSYDVNAVILLLYPSYGRTERKEAHPDVFRGLGPNPAVRKKKEALYHGIFKNNNNDSREKFYTDPLIKKLYRFLLPYMTFEVCFGKKGPKPEVKKSYCLVTRHLLEHFNLPVPRWWSEMFPAA